MKTPKEKAIELVDKMLDTEDGIDFDNGCGITEHQAKECALICVDELIKNATWKNESYYKDVKQEIEKL
jgi:hypothetical protein